MNPARFAAKWQKADLKERSAAQEHFLDLCRLVGHPTPAEADPAGEWFTFEKGAAKHAGGDGWADVWKRGFFAWEYKGKRKDLAAAYDQLLLYREALENPPLLVVCDLDRIVVHTNFTATPPPGPRARPGQPRRAPQPRSAASGLPRPGEAPARRHQRGRHRRGRAPHRRHRPDPALPGLRAPAVARFLDRVVFCFFAEDIDLLPRGLFTSLLDKTRTEPGRFARLAGQLFEAMAAGGDFGLETIRRFNGGLFASAEALELTEDELSSLAAAGALDWSAVDPSIFGTLFVRGPDPALRAQLGAQYTSREDIETLVEPVVMAPLRREWEKTRQIVENLLATGRKSPLTPTLSPKPLSPAALKKARGESVSILHRFLIRLSQVTVLDPA